MCSSYCKTGRVSSYEMYKLHVGKFLGGDKLFIRPGYFLFSSLILGLLQSPVSLKIALGLSTTELLTQR